MRINPISQLRVEDFPKEEQTWLPLLFGSLNQFLTSVTQALQQRLDFLNNTLGQQQEFAFAFAGAAASLPLKFAVTITAAPLSLTVCQATENRTPVILLAAWTYVNGQVQITDLAKIVSGVVSPLISGASYTLRVRIES